MELDVEAVLMHPVNTLEAASILVFAVSRVIAVEDLKF